MPGTKHRLWLLAAAVAATLAPTSATRADGDDFFAIEEIPGKPEYVVFGSVKDDQGNYVSTAVVAVEVADPVLIYTTPTNILGRFRTVDVGRAIVDLGYDVDPAQIRISVSAPGYTEARRLVRGSPRRTQGAFEIDFVMKKDDKSRPQR